MKKEEVKRLAPTVDTLRQLYMLSGNRCAFPGCTQAMVTEEGKFVGEVCHIEAANKGGERFNSKMTNEQRRHVSNLMLICHVHHVITDDVNEYTVEKLKKMKKEHESKFKDVAGQMIESIVDYSKSNSTKLAQNGLKINRILSWNLNPEELRETIDDLNELVGVLSDLPLNTRQLLGIMAMRAHSGSFREWEVPMDEVRHATGLKAKDFSGHLDSLERRKIIGPVDQNDNGCYECSLLGNQDWNYWPAIQEFCRKTSIDISQICTELDFTVFDD